MTELGVYLSCGLVAAFVLMSGGVLTFGRLAFCLAFGPFLLFMSLIEAAVILSSGFRRGEDDE